MKDEFYFITKFDDDPYIYKAKQQDNTYVVSWVEDGKQCSRAYPQYEVEDAIKVEAWRVSNQNGVIV